MGNVAVYAVWRFQMVDPKSINSMFLLWVQKTPPVTFLNAICNILNPFMTTTTIIHSHLSDSQLLQICYLRFKCSIRMIIKRRQKNWHQTCMIRKNTLFIIAIYNLQQGMKVKKVHRVLLFVQSPWLKTYIDYNTKQRKKKGNLITI